MESRPSDEAGVERQVLWTRGVGGYHTYRIPALCATKGGDVLAFCEGRRDSAHDTGQIDLLLRVSKDGGRNWDGSRVVVTEPGMTCGNPCPVLDRETGVIWLPFCKNRADGAQRAICEGKAPRTVWLTHSADEGLTWAEPVELTAAIKRAGWTWYATGPGHGIQLRGGRLVVPGNHTVAVAYSRSDPDHSHVIYSDDHGRTWQVGGLADELSNEATVTELADGTIYMNCRPKEGNRRVVTFSRDGGLTLAPCRLEEALPGPACEGSALRLSTGEILFANPASTVRANLVVRMTRDPLAAENPWPAGRSLHVGPAAYSDLVETRDGAVLCLYEGGEGDPYEGLVLARFDRAWVGGTGVAGAAC